MTGGSGAGLLDGGPDSDALQWWGSDPVEIDLSAGVLVGDATKELVSIYSALGGNGNDTILGSDGPNFLEGGGGNDHLEGTGGDDTLWGDGVEDWVVGPR